eukprot:m.139201 g.139201  ORF g.139201 m.139201 type:complete len:278 (+) comp16651_c0_seq2:347-1180(+)
MAARSVAFSLGCIGRMLPRVLQQQSARAVATAGALPLENTAAGAAASSNPSTSSNSSSASDVKKRILQHALTHVPVHGWSSDALVMGAADAGLPSVAKGIFPRGPAHLVEFFGQKCNDDLRAHIAAKSAEEIHIGHTQHLEDSLIYRINLLQPHSDNWSQAVALMANPANASYGLEIVYNMVDDVLRPMDDENTPPVQQFAKRAALSTVYLAAELHFLQDKSPDLADTHEFIRRRIGDLKTLHSLTESVQKTLPDISPIFNKGVNMLQELLQQRTRR